MPRAMAISSGSRNVFQRAGVRPTVSRSAAKQLGKLGVEVKMGAAVTAIEAVEGQSS